MSKFGRRIKHPPAGYEYIEPIITALENELREKVNEPHEGLRKSEAQWPIHQINWQKSRYVYDMYYTYNRISKEVYEYCITNKIVDAALIAKWKKAGYERLCSTYVINPKNYKFGTVSICRVPKQYLAQGTTIEDPVTGCRGCASGSNQNIFGNKYGQYLAAIQIAREERQAARQRQQAEDQDEDDEEQGRDDEEDEDDEGDEGEGEHVVEVDGRTKAASSTSSSSLWMKEATYNKVVSLDARSIGELGEEAQREARQAAARAGTGVARGGGGNGGSSMLGKRSARDEEEGEA